MRNAINQSGDMFSGYRANASIVFPKEVNLDNGQIMKDLGEVEKLHHIGADRLEMRKQIAELKIKWK